MDCTHQLPLSRMLEAVIGIQYDGGKEYAILWNCRCTSTQSIPWGKASEPMKAKAKQTEIKKMQIAGAI